ncbi:unnamed protein product [Coffea canephora]|uniref:Uncharacterized protein n=1 Tax=Coffea canephora TaxID=49390 RepID=A0A068UQ31_COFCA|nr:unnamed protein product [Coffea canephora]
MEEGFGFTLKFLYPRNSLLRNPKSKNESHFDAHLICLSIRLTVVAKLMFASINLLTKKKKKIFLTIYSKKEISITERHLTAAWLVC